MNPIAPTEHELAILAQYDAQHAEQFAVAHEQGRREGWADCTAAIIAWMRRPLFWLNVTSHRQLRRGAVPYQSKVKPP